jgi:L-methionine (R)-S-oxide reductase
MFESISIERKSGKPDYQLLLSQARALCEGESDPVANLANISALIMDALSDINWAGFYLWDADRDRLVLGPFQGLPACVTIKSGKGVCGTAFARRESRRVANVHDFPGHIACDGASNSELVVPIISSQGCVGVLDIDSPRFDRFSEADQEGMEQLCAFLAETIRWDEKCPENS